MDIIINDLPLSIPFTVYDVSKGHYIFSIMSPDDGAWIREKVEDLANYYDLEPDEDDKEDW